MPQAADNTNQAALEKASFDFFFFFHVNISLSKLYNWVACVCVNTIKIPLTRAELSRIKKTGARCQLLVFFFDNININSGSGKRRRKISGHFGTLHICLQNESYFGSKYYVCKKQFNYVCKKHIVVTIFHFYPTDPHNFISAWSLNRDLFNGTLKMTEFENILAG